MNSSSMKHITRNGCFDLQGFKPKSPSKSPSRLPQLSLKQIRPVTPDFTTLIHTSTNEISTILTPKLPLNPSENSPRKYILPTDLTSIKFQLKSQSGYSTLSDEKSSSTRLYFLNLEQWLTEMSAKYEEDTDAIHSLCLKEVLREVNIQCSNRARVIWKIFERLKLYWSKKIQAISTEASTKEQKLLQDNKIVLEKYQSDTDFFKVGMDEYLNKFIQADDKNTLLTRQVEILKQIIKRFQLEYKLQPIDFSKIYELVSENAFDGSQRSQTKIVNSLVPKFNRQKSVQTDQVLIVKTENKGVQVLRRKIHIEIQATEPTTEQTTQTKDRRTKKKRLFIAQGDHISVHPKFKPKLSLINTSQSKATKQENSQMKYLSVNSNQYFANGIFSEPDADNRLAITHEALFEHESRVYSACSCRSSSVDSLELTIRDALNSNKPQNSNKFHYIPIVRSFTPNHRKQKSTGQRRQVFQKFSGAKNVLQECLMTNSKKLADEANLSVRTLVKSIHSMFISSVPKIKKGQFFSFIEHVYLRLSSKYSLKRMKEKRLRDLIASSIKYKDMQLPKLFLRLLGAGKCIGLSNYSIHTYKIMLQIMMYLNTSTPNALLEIGGRKMCPKSCVIDCAKELFKNRLDPIELVRLISQIESRSKSDSYGLNKEGIVEYEWSLNYMIYSFDYYEKQVITGLKLVIESVTLNSLAVCITKAEFIVALKIFHPEVAKILEDPNTIKYYSFLKPSVPLNALLSVTLAEKFSLFRGLFKPKYIENFRTRFVKPVTDFNIDKLGYFLDTLDQTLFESSVSKPEWQKKVYMLREFKNIEFSYAIFSKEIERISYLSSP